MIDFSPGPLEDEYKRNVGSSKLYLKIYFEDRPIGINFGANPGDDCKGASSLIQTNDVSAAPRVDLHTKVERNNSNCPINEAGDAKHMD